MTRGGLALGSTVPLLLALISGLAAPRLSTAQYGSGGEEWPSYAGDNGGTKYSPLSQIDRTNVKDLETAWTWITADVALYSVIPRLARATIAAAGAGES